MQMKKSVWVGVLGVGLLGATLVAVSAPAQAVTARAGGVPVIDLAVKGNQVTISQATMRPGVVEFHVGKTFTMPGKRGGPDTISIVRTDQLDQVLQLAPAVFSGDPGKPATMAAAAQAITAIRGLSTWYGGGNTGGVWQVALPVGNYYAIGVQSTAMGLAKPVAFSVVGDPRTATLHSTEATVRAIAVPSGNAWKATGLSSLGEGWLKFANSAKELHFMNFGGVKPDTTNAMVKKVLEGGSHDLPSWVIGPDYSFDVVSPGVVVAIKGPFQKGRYLLDCFMPSESDGTPHALMGMWKLVTVG